MKFNVKNIYDYATGNVTRDMTRAEVNAALAKYRESKSATSKNFSFDAKNEIKDEKISKTVFENEFSEEKSRPTAKDIKAANEAKAQAAVIESLAKEKIKDYADLSKENQSMIRKVLREAAEAIWQIYNEDLTAGECREAAHDISEFLVARVMRII